MTKECSSPNVKAAPERKESLGHAALGFDWSLDLGHWSFLADWDRTLMLHYEIEPEKLQPFVPFPLDVRNGKAYVSIVAFIMRGLRPRRGGRLAALAFKPIATHELLNVRTYVKHGGDSGIYFLAEWIPNLLSVPLGRPLFGLPYRWGKLAYLHEHERGVLFGNVRARGVRGALRYRAKVGLPFAPCTAGSLAEWLMERYTAFTEWRGWKRCFRVRHEPWPQCAVEAEVLEDSLLALTGEWARYARFIGATYSPGVRDVQMSCPSSVTGHSSEAATRVPEPASLIHPCDHEHDPCHHRN